MSEEKEYWEYWKKRRCDAPACKLQVTGYCASVTRSQLEIEECEFREIESEES